MRFFALIVFLVCFHVGLFAQEKTVSVTPLLNNVHIPTTGNSWMLEENKSPRTIDFDYNNDWVSPSSLVRTYFYVQKPCKLSIDIEAKVIKGTSSIKVTFEDEPKIIMLTDTTFVTQKLGNFTIKYPGYYYVDLQGMSKTAETFADVKSIILSSQSSDLSVIKFIDKDFYFGRRGPSVHLAYQIPSKISDVEWFYNEVEVKEGQDVIGSYFMADGFGEGYFGMQVNSSSERRVLFSVWSPFDTNDPKSIPAEDKIKLLKKGNNVKAGEFGNEGSGGQSFMRYQWKAGVRYKFLLHGKPVGNNTTVYTAYFYDPQINKWNLIASFSRPKTTTYLTGLHSFLENFIPDNGVYDRKCGYYNQWVVDKSGNWYPINKAVLTADNTALSQRRFDYSGGSEGSGFYLRMGGFTNNIAKPYSLFVRPQSGPQPKIDLNQFK